MLADAANEESQVRAAAARLSARVARPNSLPAVPAIAPTEKDIGVKAPVFAHGQQDSSAAEAAQDFAAETADSEAWNLSPGMRALESRLPGPVGVKRTAENTRLAAQSPTGKKLKRLRSARKDRPCDAEPETDAKIPRSTPPPTVGTEQDTPC